MLELRWAVAQATNPDLVSDMVLNKVSLMVSPKPLKPSTKSLRRPERKLLPSKVKMLLPKEEKRRPLRKRLLPKLMPPTRPLSS